MEEDRCTCCGVRLGRWSETLAPVRVLEAERFLAGRRLDDRSLAEAVAVAADASGGWEIDPPPLADAIRRAAARGSCAAA
jgi:hypothetical protein